MRIYLYILAGVTSALIGWNVGQFFLTGLKILEQFPEIILFPCIAISLAIGMVLTEIFISNPTRPKLNWRIGSRSLAIAAALGLFAGLIAGLIYQILKLLPIFNEDKYIYILRVFGWLIIGGATGLAEGLTWRWRSIESGDRKRFKKRLLTSVIGSSAASLVAALIFESLPKLFGKFPLDWEDPIGFSILGILLGLVFSLTTSPSYMVALRAGTGFEYTGEEDDTEPEIGGLKHTPKYPIIEKKESQLKFVSDGYAERIEEGLSIQLPANGKIRIGSADKAHIRIPELPLHVADLEFKHRETLLVPNPKFFYTIEVNGEQLQKRKPISLKHNYVLTFYPQERSAGNEQNFFRFVYYNRFLDPQA